MEKILKEKKLGFFGKMKLAIFRLEDYGMFLGEKLRTSFKYFFVLVLLASMIMAIGYTYVFYNMTQKLYNYIKLELPDFTYENATLNFENEVFAYDEEYNISFFANTTEDSKEFESLARKKIQEFNYDETVILLKEKAVFVSKINEIEINYSDLESELELSQSFSKNDLVEQIDGKSIRNVILTYYVADVIGVYIGNVISILADVCIVALFGWISAKFAGVNFKLSPMITLSIYSLTLSILLSSAYVVANNIAGFYIEHFNIIYLLIAYVYIIAAIFMIKYDLIKQGEELQKILEIQKQIKEEPDFEEEDKSEENTNENKSDEKKSDDEEKVDEIPNPIEENREPDGSEI